MQSTQLTPARALLALLALGALASTAVAQDWGLFAPKDSALYVRIADVQGMLAKTPGGWKKQFDAFLAMIPEREKGEVGPVIEEFRRFLESAKSLEFALDPDFSPIVVVTMGPGSPAALTEVFQKFVQEQGGPDVKVTPTSIEFEGGHFKLAGSRAYFVYGDAAFKRLEEALAGNNTDTLGRHADFANWSKAVQGDLCLWLTFDALREAAEGQIDAELAGFLKVVEWEKWKTLSLTSSTTADYQGTMTLDLQFAQALEFAKVFLKPASTFDLAAKLPKQTVGFVGFQLGDNHAQTYNEMLVLMHRAEQIFMASSAQWRLEYQKQQISDYEEMIKTAAPEDKVYYEEQLQYLRQELAELETMAKGGEPRAFMPKSEDREAAGISRETEAEEFAEEFEQVLGQIGTTKDEIFGVLGNELIMGILFLPTPSFSPEDFEQLWYIMAEAKADTKALRDKFKAFLDKEGAPVEWVPVAGGEIIREKGPFGDVTVFMAPSAVGFAPNEEVALAVLNSLAGKDCLDPKLLPMGAAIGSKIMYLNLFEILASVFDSMETRSREYLSEPEMNIDLRKLMPGGFRLSMKTDEKATGLQLAMNTAGESNYEKLFNEIMNQVSAQATVSYDRETLSWEIANACQTWLSNTRDKLAGMEPADVKAMLAKINLQTLQELGYLQPRDGLRSSLDPALKAAFEAVKKGEKETMGDPTSLKQSGFEWHGLPVDVAAPQDSPYYGGYYGNAQNIWMVCSQKFAWSQGGRLALIHTGGDYFATVYMTQEIYDAVLAANKAGKRLANIPAAKITAPLWKVRRMLRNRQWTLQDLSGRLNTYRDTHGKFPVLQFKGAEAENPTQVLKGLLEINEDWFYVDGPEKLEIQSTEKGFKLRYVEMGHWIELDQDGELKASWQD